LRNAILLLFPGSKIRTCYFHLLQAIRKNGKFYFEDTKGLITEFMIFWYNTRKIEDLQFNLKILEKNLNIIYGLPEKVNNFMAYFIEEYVNKKGNKTGNWLHFGDKEYYYYDSTNNNSEVLNAVLKDGEKTNMNVRNIARKLKNSLENSIYAFQNTELEHGYDTSIKKTMTNKERRMKKTEKRVRLHKESFVDRKEYTIHTFD